MFFLELSVTLDRPMQFDIVIYTVSHIDLSLHRLHVVCVHVYLTPKSLHITYDWFSLDVAQVYVRYKPFQHTTHMQQTTLNIIKHKCGECI